MLADYFGRFNRQFFEVASNAVIRIDISSQGMNHRIAFQQFFVNFLNLYFFTGGFQ